MFSGSLSNTWRQGDWKRKYKWGPKKVSIMRPSNIPETCSNKDDLPISPDIQINLKDYDFCMCDYNRKNENTQSKSNWTDTNEDLHINTDKTSEDNELEIDEKDLYVRNEEFFTESMYENDYMETVEIIDNYELQANFVRDLFLSQNNDIENCRNDSNFQDNLKSNEIKCDKCTNNYADLEANNSDTYGVFTENKECEQCNGQFGDNVENTCTVGCGCICEKCYSTCWPRDWLRVDYPNARIISINYTSDPYLWRPIWIKECKRYE